MKIHLYTSTACFHELCAECRQTCKFCGEPCQHDCHDQDDGE